MANEQQVKLDKTAVAIYNRVLKEKITRIGMTL